MINFRITFISLLVSLVGHACLLVLPGFSPLVMPEKPQDIEVEIRITDILPPIEQLSCEPKISQAEEHNIIKIPVKDQLPPDSADLPSESEKETPMFNKTADKDHTGPILRQDNQSTENPEKLSAEDVKEEMLRYQDMIKQRIQAARRYPAWAMKHGIEGNTRLCFVVLANGSVDRVSITGSSGCRVLDSAATATIYRASPFPCIPSIIGVSSLKIDVVIVFAL